ncbi:MAG: MFS transporter [Shimia sp.]
MATSPARGGSAQTPPAPPLALMMLVAALSVLSLNMFLPALPRIAEAFGVSYGTATWSLTGYLAATAVLQLIVGSLSDRYGRRPLVLVSLAAFVVSCVVCALARDFATFMAGRLAMGLVITGATMALASIRDTAPAEAAAARISWVSMGMAIGPMVGPVLGGVLDAVLGWRAIFWVMGAGGAAALGLSLAFWGETNLRRSASFLAQARGYPTLLSSGAFWAYALSGVTGIGIFYVFVTGAPLVGEVAFGLGPAEVGVAIGTITAGFFVGNYVSGRVAARAGLGVMICAGRGLQVVAIALAGLGIAAGGGPLVVFGPIVLVGFGNGLANPSGHAGVMSVRPDLAGSAAGLNGALIMAGGAVLTALASVAITPADAAASHWAIMMVVASCGAAVGLWCLAIQRRGGAVADPAA